MRVYLVTFPGIWFRGHAIVVAPNKEAAIFYAANRHSTHCANYHYLQDFKASDFVAQEIDFNQEGIFDYDSGDY